MRACRNPMVVAFVAAVVAATGWLREGTAAVPAVDDDGKPDPWAGTFRVYEGDFGPERRFSLSGRFGGKVTIERKGAGYQLDWGGKLDLKKVDNRLEPSPETGYPKWVELGEKDGDGFPVLVVVGSFNRVYLVRGKPPATWTIVPGEARPGRAPSPAAAVLSNWKVCREYELDGTSHARVDDCPELRVASLTLSAWVKTSDVSLMQPVVAKAEAKGNWCSYLLRIQDGGRVALAVENTAGERSAHWRSKAALAAKKWHHVAATWANTTGDASDAKIYIDGVPQELEMIRSVGYGKEFRIGYSALPLYIGRDEFPSGHFVGTLRDVDVLGRVLTADEVKKVAARGMK